MTSMFPNLCLSCTRYRNSNKCQAFPAGIPDSIFALGGDHRQPVEGDRGFQFELRDDTTSRDRFATWQRVLGS